VIYLLAAIAGAALGLFYFGALWLTVRSLAGSDHPILLAMGSLFGRLAVVVGAFYLVATFGGWIAVLIALSGFILARIILVRRWRPLERTKTPV